MAQLIKCIECGGEISSEAGICPHCRTHFPKNTICVVCTKIGRVSDMRVCGKYYMHEACIAEINQCQYSCPVCRNLITTQDNAWHGCTKCGHPIETVSCRYCENYLIKYFAVELSKKDGFGFAHKACYTSRHSSSSCFIATAALGSPLAPEVKTLQTFRDNVLRKCHFGRRFIALYESVSPPFAHIIARNDVLRYLTRLLIVYPVTWLAKWALKS